MKRRLSWVLVLVLATSLACNYEGPEYTPNSAQQTSFWSNTQIAGGTATAAARATETATPTGHLQNASTDVAGTLSVTPAPTDTPTATFTSSICVIDTPGPGTWVAVVTECP